MSYQRHQCQANAAQQGPVRCAILTISDTRTPDTDESGAAIRAALEQSGHTIARYHIVQDAADQIQALLHDFADDGCQIVITNGGTGMTRRDTTFEAVERLLEKHMPGFGELFRMLSYEEIGAAAMLSRATAGTYRQMVIFCVPGSPGAVRLAMEQLIMPELVHLVWELQRQEPEHANR